jgi:hypothetical protein
MHQACHRLVNRQAIDAATKERRIGLDAGNARTTFGEEHSFLRKYLSHDGSNDI